MKEKTIIISGVNLFRGGTLKVMRDCLKAISAYHPGMYRIIAIVYKKELYEEYPGVEFLEFSKSRNSWFHRIYYEFWGFKKFFKEQDIYCWLSLHDVTTNINAKIRAVYCHNPSPFYKTKIRDLWVDSHFFMFTIFYKWLYKCNIKKNTFVIVQQQWLRDAFEKMFHINNVVISFPKSEREAHPIELAEKKSELENRKIRFLYPALPSIFKNFEVIAEASILLNERGIFNFEVYLTINGSENKYASYICNKYSSVKSISFLGVQTKESMNHYYNESDCIIFPSKLETWGLPITEAKDHHKPILLSDLPYARETVGKYDKVKFFDPENPIMLATLMEQFILNNITYDPTNEIIYEQPFADNWNELFDILLSL